MDGSQNTSAVTTAVCGMVTDGTWSLLDTLYVFAVNSTANASLNWISSSYSLTKNGTCAFAANAGYTGDGSTCYFNTGYTPKTAGGNLSQNSANLGTCILSSRTTNQSYAELGTDDNGSGGGSTILYMQPLTSGSFFYDVNGNTFPSFTTTNTQGQWLTSRTASGAIALYKNGSSVATPSDPSGTLSGYPAYIMAYNSYGTPFNHSADQLAEAHFGGGFTSTQANNFYSRMHTYYAAVGASGC